MRYFEDFKPGDVFELGSYTITKEEIIEFATQFDPQPFHIDEEKAKDSLFGGLAASGWHTGSIYMRLLVQNFLTQTVSMGSPGLDNLRWLKPVYPGDILSARFTMLELVASKSRPNLGIVKGKGEIFNQNGDLVMSLDSVGFFGKKPE
jgi:acyl dehydratase